MSIPSLLSGSPIPIHSLPEEEKKIQKSPGNQKKALDETNLGYRWLVAALQKEIRKGDTREFDTLLFAILNTNCRKSNNWNTAALFPDRRISADDVAKMSLQELKALPSQQYFAIIDLISGPQAMEIINNPEFEEARRSSLYFFNTNFSTTFVDQMNNMLNMPVEARVKEYADKYFKSLELITPGKMQRLIRLSKKRGSLYRQLDAERHKISETLSGKTTKNPKQFLKNWEKVNRQLLVKGIQKPITEDFLTKINTSLRGPKATETGLRRCGVEVFDPQRSLFYLPGSAVKRQINIYIKWLNQQIMNADENRDECNPIIIAASACQRLATIKPYLDANGRTARFLADLILRRYHLPPVAWHAPFIAVFPVGKRKDGQTSTTAVQSLIKGLAKSYEIMGIKNESKASSKEHKLYEPQIPTKPTQMAKALDVNTKP